VDEAAIVLQQNAWQDERFRSSDPFRKHRFEGAVSAPIIEDGEAVAVLLVCRLSPTPLKATEFAFLQSLASALTAVSAQDAEMDELRRKVAELTDKLAVRKLVERAKGILQEQLQLTEEQAYLSMRRLSRRRGIPMGAVAEALIEDAGVREIHLEG
jgi:uroporphyrinogen-III synthase